MSLDLYMAQRPRMFTGDLLLWRSKSILGGLIRFFSNGNVNHAGLVIRFDAYDRDSVFTLEALSHGIVLNRMSESLKRYDGEVYHVPLKPECNSYRPYIGLHALRLVGKKYDYGNLFKQAFARVSTNAEKLFCSEYVGVCWKRAGLDVNIDKAPRPGDMENDFAHILEPRVRIL